MELEKEKKVRSDSLRKAQQKYYQKNKDTPEFKERVKKATATYYKKIKSNPDYREARRASSKNYYYTNRTEILQKRKVSYQNKKSSNNNNEVINSDTDLQ